MIATSINGYITIPPFLKNDLNSSVQVSSFASVIEFLMALFCSTSNGIAIVACASVAALATEPAWFTAALIFAAISVGKFAFHSKTLPCKAPERNNACTSPLSFATSPRNTVPKRKRFTFTSGRVPTCESSAP